MRLRDESGSFAGASFKQKIKTRQGQENKFHKLRLKVRWPFRELQTQQQRRIVARVHPETTFWYEPHIAE
jgi:hypothetical protein